MAVNSASVKNLIRVRGLRGQGGSRASRLEVAGKTIKPGTYTVLDSADARTQRELARYNADGKALVEGAAVVVLKQALAVGTGGGSVASIKIPDKALITRVILDITTASAAGATLNAVAGATAADGTAGVTLNGGGTLATTPAGTTSLPANGTAVAVAANSFVAVTPSASPTNLVGSIYVHYIPLV